MVFEQLYKTKWIEQKAHSFFLGFIYTIIGIFSAQLIFPRSAGLMSVAFASILLIPSLAALLKLETNSLMKKTTLNPLKILQAHKDIIKVYIFLFLGIFTAYSAISLLYPQAAVSNIFESQLRVAGLTGNAFNVGKLGSIIFNNLIVFVVCFILSLSYGAGAVLFLTWNASVWGVVFAYVAKLSALQSNAWIGFGSLMLPVLPHLITEALAYVNAAIVGGVVSKAVLREQLGSKKFMMILTDAFVLLLCGVLLVVIAAIIEVRLL